MKTFLNKMITVVFLMVLSFSALCQSDSSEIRPLEQFVGYYDVGVKPDKPFFKSRWYIKDDKLYTIYDSDTDRQFVPYENGQLRYNVFFSDMEFPDIGIDDTTYYVVLKFEDDQLQEFKVIRPRSEWKTDLYGYRIPALDSLAVHAEKDMNSGHETTHFRFVFNAKDEDFVKSFAEKIEGKYAQLLIDFEVKDVPVTTFKIYPDLPSYHNGVLTPNAPEWQSGRVWTESQIKLVSPSYLATENGETISGDLLIHEYIHILHWNKRGDPESIPKWLWEGLALYKGCCEWGKPEELDYLIKGKYPSIQSINRTREYQYELGYYLIEFIDEKWGWDLVLKLVESNGEIKEVLGISNKVFEKQFYEYMEQQYLK